MARFAADQAKQHKDCTVVGRARVSFQARTRIAQIPKKLRYRDRKKDITLAERESKKRVSADFDQLSDETSGGAVGGCCFSYSADCPAFVYKRAFDFFDWDPAKSLPNQCNQPRNSLLLVHNRTSISTNYMSKIPQKLSDVVACWETDCSLP